MENNTIDLNATLNDINLIVKELNDIIFNKKTFGISPDVAKVEILLNDLNAKKNYFKKILKHITKLSEHLDFDFISGEEKLYDCYIDTKVRNLLRRQRVYRKKDLININIIKFAQERQTGEKSINILENLLILHDIKYLK